MTTLPGSELPATAPLAPSAAATGAAPSRAGSPRSAATARTALTVLHLVAVGAVGPALFSLLATFAGLGVGLLPVLGIGLPFLIVFAYLLLAVGWLETARVDGLYRLGLPPLRARRSARTGFGGFLHTLWLQLIDPAVWKAVAHAAIATLIGMITLTLVSVAASGAALAFAPLYAEAERMPLIGTGLHLPVALAPVLGTLSALLSLAAIVGLALLHEVIAKAILVPSREAQLAEAARVSNVQRAGAVHAADVERTRIERDLHDGVQPRLVSVGMTLGLAQQKLDTDPDAAKELLAEAHTSTKAAITELRQLARGIHTSVLDDRGLDAALSALAARSVVPVHLDVRLDGRCSRDAETAVYFAIAESLTNAAKHAHAGSVRVVVRRRDAEAGGLALWARVEDDGVGGARVVPGGGLDGIVNRIVAAGGTARLDSPAGGPTSVEVSVPCAS